MAFLPLIPQGTDQLSVSQGDILNNFTILGAIAGNANASSGSLNVTSGFNWVYMPTNGVAIPPAGAAFPAGELGIYSATNGTTTKNELYINKTNQATVVQVPMTASIMSQNSAPAALSNGWTYLPSGILLKWGANQVVTGSQTINFPAGSPPFTQCITVMLTVAQGGGADVNRAIRLVSVAPTGFTAYGSTRTSTGAAATTFTYLAIGY